MKLRKIALVALLSAIPHVGYAQSNLKETLNIKKGIELLGKGDVQSAETMFAREISTNPRNSLAYMYIANIRLGQNRLDEAEEQLMLAEQFLPNQYVDLKAMLYCQYCSLAKARKDKPGALKYINSAIRLDHEKAEFYQTRGEVYTMMGELKKAAKDYRKSMSLEPFDVGGYLGLILTYERMGELIKAQELCDATITKFGNHPGLNAIRARILIMSDDIQGAIQDILKSYSVKDNELADNLVERVAQDYFEQIMGVLKEKQAEEPDSLVWEGRIGFALTGAKKYEEALGSLFKVHFKIKQGKYFSHLVGNFDKIVKEKGKEYAENVLNSYIEKGYTNGEKLKLVSTDGMGLLISLLNLDIQENPDRAQFYSTRGDAYYSLHYYQEALNDYTRFMELDDSYSRNTIFLFNLAECYRHTGSVETANDIFKSIILFESAQISPNAMVLAYTYSSLNDAENAMKNVEQYIALERENPHEAYYTGACVKARLGDHSEALRYLAKALENGYESLDHVERDEDLEKVREMPEYKELIKKYKK